MSEANLKDVVRQKYGGAARRASTGGQSSCCGPAECGCADPITSTLYEISDTAGLPAEAVAASLGCGNPSALAQLNPGDIVLDLGSGGGIDVLLSAQRVGKTGFAYGLDMTDEMLTLARRNAAEAGATNVEFRFDILNVFNTINFDPVANPGSGSTIFQVGGAYQDPSNTFDPGGRLGQLMIRVNW